MLKIAKKELEDWYKTHDEQIAKTKAANRWLKLILINLKFDTTALYNMVLSEKLFIAKQIPLIIFAQCV